jgi:general secretion pathway protein J
MTPARSRSAQTGFTLIEMMIALLIFSFLAVAGILVLRQGAFASEASRTRLDALARDERAANLIAQDLIQAVSRTSRATNGVDVSAFVGAQPTSQRPFMQFIRGGVVNGDDAPGIALQRIDYWLIDGTLRRQSYTHLDGGAPGTPAVLLSDVSTFAVQFRGHDGVWRDDWRPDLPNQRPTAVALVISLRGGAPVRQLFLISPPDVFVAPRVPRNG